MTAQNIVIVAFWFPPINSSGAKRMEAMAKYFARAGRTVTVVTPAKTYRDGAFTEPLPENVAVHELGWFGRGGTSQLTRAPRDGNVPGGGGRGFKDAVMKLLGQVPDPRIPFALGFISPLLPRRTRDALKAADVIVATCPPWPTLLGAIFAHWRWGTPAVLDYRDQFSLCHEMPGGRLAKAIELVIDKFLIKRAAALVTISEPMSDYYRAYHNDVTTIMNGYDPEWIERAKRTAQWQPRAEGKPLILRYLGVVTPGRIPRKLLEGMRSVLQAGRLKPGTLIIEYYGECSMMERVLETEFPELAGFFAFLPRVSYSRALELAVSADHLLFCENSIPAKAGEEKSASGILTTKLFEYLASGRPVFAHIGGETLAGSFIRRANDRHFVSDDPEAFRTQLTSEEFWNPQPCAITPFVDSLSRAGQADQYLLALDAIAGRAGRHNSPAGSGRACPN